MNSFETALGMLRERGWTKHTAETSDGRICVGQALMLTVEQQMGEPVTRDLGYLNRRAARYTPLTAALGEVIGEQFPDRAGPVIWFNDHADTVWEDVEAVLEKAAAA